MNKWQKLSRRFAILLNNYLPFYNQAKHRHNKRYNVKTPKLRRLDALYYNYINESLDNSLFALLVYCATQRINPNTESIKHLLFPPMASYVRFCITIFFCFFLSLSSSQKVTLSLYYEALCPFCADFIVNHLPQIFQNGLISSIDLHLVPWGNTLFKPDGTILCQVSSCLSI